ncbi:unnamed protein product [marine sediment metagenome]|uniref:Uncharacterized protein n=1 Tax=marine sediment metagenome TaxID=412755 RepID=X1LEL6_9ZZZZ
MSQTNDGYPGIGLFAKACTFQVALTITRKTNPDAIKSQEKSAGGGNTAHSGAGNRMEVFAGLNYHTSSIFKINLYPSYSDVEEILRIK